MGLISFLSPLAYCLLREQSRMSQRMKLVEETESHVVVFLGGGLLLGFLLWCLLSGSTTGGGTTSGWGSAGTDTGADVGDQLADVDVLEGTSEERWPEWLDLDVGGLEDGGDLVASDLAVIVVEDESGVGAGELRSHIYPKSILQLIC